jgi:hypothetical protein
LRIGSTSLRVRDPAIEAIRCSLPPYIISRLLLGIAAAIVIASLPGRSIGPTTVFTTWDSQWYLSIAEHGYVPDHGVVRPNGPAGADTSVDGAVAFFPMYPMAVAGIGALIPIATDDVAIGAAILFGAAATIAYAKLARSLRGSEEADRAVLLFCFFPGAFVLSLAYPEGLLILLACLCLLQLQRRAWVLAGVFAAAAAATRPNGLALTASCAVASFLDIRASGKLRSIIAPLLAPIGFLAFVGFLWWRTGEPSYWFRTNRVFWHDRLGSWPELQAISGAISDPATRSLLLVGLVVGCLVLIALVILMFRAHLPPPVIAYALAYEALALLTGALAPRPRFLLAAFPLVMAAGFALRGQIFSIALAISSGTMVLMFLFYTMPYLQGRFPVAP